MNSLQNERPEILIILTAFQPYYSIQLNLSSALLVKEHTLGNPPLSNSREKIIDSELLFHMHIYIRIPISIPIPIHIAACAHQINASRML